ncbi:YgjV family protein [Kalamiella sp. sgz302252]|uniref:YgjV family protein n=1 Tax=Pantoea sp. sgz302252 TaxID=3341827 RepID=UPI0036D29A7E
MTPVDILGYAGTALVITSFLCQSLIKLRLLNAVGASFVTLYAILTHAWPVAILDGFIVVINVFQLLRHRKNSAAVTT